MTPRFVGSDREVRPTPRPRRGPKWYRLGVERLEERLAPAGLPPDLVVGRTLSAYSVADVADHSLTVTYTVYNQRAADVSGVLLTTTLQPGVAFTTATQPPDRSGSELAWSLGTLPAYGRASVALTVTLPDPLPLAIDAGATAFGTLNAGAVSADTPAVTLTTRVLPPDLLASTPDANTADPFVQEQAARLRYDPAAIFAYLNTDVGYESYTGSLRGARGTLWSAAGNALDEASLGVALFRASGIPARYAHGTLSDPLSKQLILSMFPASYQTVGYVPPGTATADPANDPKLLAETRDHYWLQVDTGAGFQNADSSGLPGGGVGTAFTTATDTFAQVADGLRHKVRVRLDAEIYNSASALFGLNSPLGTTTVLDHTFNSVDLVGRPLTVGHFVTRSALGALVFSSQTTTYSPYLIVGDLAYPDGARDDHAIRGTDYQDVQTNFPFGSQLVTGVFLGMTLTGPDGPAETFTRELADRIGFAARRGGGGTVSITADSLPVLSPYDTFTLYAQSAGVVAGPLLGLQAAVAGQAARASETAADGTATPAAQAAGLRGLLTASRSNGLAYLAQSQTATAQLVPNARVLGYPDRPRLILSSLRLTPPTAGRPAALVQSLDLRRDRVRAVPFPGQAAEAGRLFQTARGLLDDRLEGAVLPAVPVTTGETAAPAVSTGSVFDAARAQNVPSAVVTAATLTVLDGLALSAEAKARITAAARAGMEVLVPVRAVDVGGVLTTAWYEFDPATGETTGVSEDGGHQGITEYGALVGLSLIVTYEVLNGLAYLGGFLYGYFLRQLAARPYINISTNEFQLVVDKDALRREMLKAFEIVNPPFTYFYQKGLVDGIGSWLEADPPAGQVLTGVGGPPPARGGTATVAVPAAATAGAVTGAVRAGSVSAAGQLAATWRSAGTTGLTASALAATATVTDAAGNPIGSGAVGLAAGEVPLAVGPGADFAVTGTGRLVPYAAAGSGLGVAADWDDFAATVTGGVVLTVTTDALTLNGTRLPPGTYTLSTGTAVLSGRGPSTSPTFAGSVAVNVTGGTVQVGPGTGTLSVGRAALDPAVETTFTGYTGTLAVTPGGADLDAVALNGTAAHIVRVTVPAARSADQNTPVTFPVTVRSSLGGDYTVSVEAPSGWSVAITAAGTVTVTPAAGLQGGTYPVRVVARSVANPELVAQATVAVTVTPTAPGLALGLTPDPLLTVPYAGVGLPNAFRATVHNLGPAADTFAVTAAGLPAGFSLRTSGTSLSVPAGRTGVVGLYLVPATGAALPAPGTVLTFTVTATSTTTPALTQTRTVSFTMPAIHAVTLTGTPAVLNTTPGEPVTATITVRAVGNVSETVALTAAVPAGLTVTGLPPTLTLAPDQTATVRLTVTPAADTPLNSTLNLAVTAALGPTASDTTTQRLQLPVRVAVPGADAIAASSTAAADLGNADLAARLNDLSTALTNLVQTPGSPVFRGQAVAALDVVRNLAAADPYLAAVLPALAAGRGQLTAATTGAEVRAATVALGDALGAFGATLAAELAHRFDLSLAGNTAVAQPLVPVGFNVLLRNVGTETTTYDLTVTGLPAGVTAAFSQTSVTLAPGQSTFTPGNPALTLTLTPGANEIAAAGFEMRATARPTPVITRTASGSLTARREFVSVVAVTPAPAFVDPGGAVVVSARVLNAVNREQSGTARFVVTDAGGTVRFTSAPVAVTLGVLTSLTTLALGTLTTTGFAVGDYTLTVTVSDAAGQPIPGAIGRGHLLVGSPVSASLSVGPESLPPGTSTVTNSLVIHVQGQPVGPLGVVSLTELPGAGGVVKNGHYVYASGTTGVRVFDIADPSNPQLIRTFGSSATTLEIRGDKLFGLNWAGPSGRFTLMI